jgi:flagellar biosynthetic protein FliR
MSLFNFNAEELLTFFAVLVRYSVLIAILPFLGDRLIPSPLKILLGIAFTLVLYPTLVASGSIRPGDAVVWGATAGGIVGTVAVEVVCALIMGYTAKLAFEAINFGGNLVGNFMGFGMASTYDPHHETQTQVVAEIQMAIAMLLFLAIDGHHLMLRASLQSYSIVGIGGNGALGQATLGAAVSARLAQLTGEVIKFAIQISAPIAVSLFAVNIAFGVMAKAMPQLNILVLSVSVSAIVGLVVMLLSLPEFNSVAGNILSRMGDSMESIMRAMVGR